MPQGKTQLAKKQASGGKKKVADKKKGLRAIPPKKSQTVRQATQHKVSSMKPYIRKFRTAANGRWNLAYNRK
jgi:hypothetical protein